MDMRKIGPPALGEQVADRLLDLLSTDDEFRVLFVRDTKAAMEIAGYVHEDATAAHPAFCYVVTNLASKDAIAQHRTKLKSALNSIQDFDCPRELMGA
jgi:putative modified peptide